MPYLVGWSPHALVSVQRIYRFLAEKDLEAAKAAVTAILGKANVLEDFPNVGRPADDLEPEQRELFIPFGATGFVLLYHFDEQEKQILILAVRHQKEVGY